MDLGAALIAHFEAPEAIEPGQCPLHHPAIAPVAGAPTGERTRHDASRPSKVCRHRRDHDGEAVEEVPQEVSSVIARLAATAQP